MLSPKGPANISGKSVKIENRSVTLDSSMAASAGAMPAMEVTIRSGASSGVTADFSRLDAGTRRAHARARGAAHVEPERIPNVQRVRRTWLRDSASADQ